MSKVYIAKNAIGQFNAGEEIPVVTKAQFDAAVKNGETINGLTDERVEYLLSIGAIAEKGSENADEGEVVQLDKLTNDELKALLDEEGIEYNKSDDKKTLIALFPKD